MFPRVLLAMFRTISAKRDDNDLIDGRNRVAARLRAAVCTQTAQVSDARRRVEASVTGSSSRDHGDGTRKSDGRVTADRVHRRRSGCGDPVASFRFGQIEVLVGSRDQRLQRLVLGLALGDPEAGCQFYFVSGFP